MITIEITKENIIQNLHRLHPFDCYGLAEIALKHYDKSLNDESPTGDFLESAKKLGFKNWRDVVEKYNNEVGYDSMIFEVEE